MKKLFLFLLLLLTGSTGFAQDYAPLPDTGIRRYFINSAGYLRGIRVDSVVQENGYKRYVTFRTARGWKPGTDNSYLADSNGACWIGKNVRAYPNGDWHFPNVAGDTILVKTTAKVGDTWAFHRDTSTIWTEAKVLSVDTQTVFGVLDSVKRIQLTLNNGSTTLPSNPISAFQIILSKTMGFAQVPDLYLFPYKDLTPGNGPPDYWYRKLKIGGSNIPDKETLLFSHVDNWNPSEREMYDFNVGDVTFKEHFSSFFYKYDYYLDTITARQDFPTFTEYTYTSWSWKRRADFPSGLISIENKITTAKKFNKPTFDTLYMPEEFYGGCYSYLYINLEDSSFCSRSPFIEQSLGPGCGLYVGSLQYPVGISYKGGLGQVYYGSGSSPDNIIKDKFYSYRKNGISCQFIPQPPLGSHSFLSRMGSFTFYPQPATTEVFLEAPQFRYPAIIRIQNLQGQLLSTQELSAAGKPISTAGLPAGLYLISVTDAGGNSAVQKLLIEAN